MHDSIKASRIGNGAFFLNILCVHNATCFQVALSAIAAMLNDLSIILLLVNSLAVILHF